jgi:CRISPR/Cas system-associated endonuclease Cas1
MEMAELDLIMRFFTIAIKTGSSNKRRICSKCVALVSAFNVTQNLLIFNKSLQNVVKFKYFGRTVTNRSCIHDEIKSKLNLGNACYRSLQSLLSKN